MKARIEEIKNYALVFDDETSIHELGIKADDMFSIHVKDGEVILKPYESIELDLSLFSDEEKNFLIKKSCDENISINKVFENILTKCLNKL